MIGGNPNDFLDRIYSCQDTIYIYKGVKYWFQGYMPDPETVHMEVVQYQPSSEKEIWSHNDTTIERCQQAFIKAPLFDGRSFWDAEQEIEWVDD